jgi:hypothetical protein
MVGGRANDSHPSIALLAKLGKPGKLRAGGAQLVGYSSRLDSKPASYDYLLLIGLIYKRSGNNYFVEDA